MDRDHPEYKRLLEEAAQTIHEAVHSRNVVEWEYLPGKDDYELADKILSIPGLEIADPDQGLPYRLYTAGSPSAYRQGRQDMLEANFKKVI